ncbi:hypothetical protein SteCoe_11945 [Stentor coeruleus]|uniref:Uncharacterized protein n=1 Tax=Stentor coeruleus TaxID=5963 RepID=A0A1R2CC01_9CILI|nr:hypothetical protein SteCoe_11945 [Stentor coeruleus]
MSESQNWHKDLCSCFDATPICLMNFCCPIIGAGITQYIAHRNIPGLNESLSLYLALTCCCLGNAINRKRMRSKLKLGGNFICDCIFYIFYCHTCMVVQEYQEVNWHILNKY